MPDRAAGGIDLPEYVRFLPESCRETARSLGFGRIRCASARKNARRCRIRLTDGPLAAGGETGRRSQIVPKGSEKIPDTLKKSEMVGEQGRGAPAVYRQDPVMLCQSARTTYTLYDR